MWEAGESGALTRTHSTTLRAGDVVCAEAPRCVWRFFLPTEIYWRKRMRERRRRIRRMRDWQLRRDLADPAVGELPGQGADPLPGWVYGAEFLCVCVVQPIHS